MNPNLTKKSLYLKGGSIYKPSFLIINSRKPKGSVLNR